MNKLLQYIEAKKKGGSGWLTQYEQSLSEKEVTNAFLTNHYQNLLDDALSLVPPAFLTHLQDAQPKPPRTTFFNYLSHFWKTYESP